MSAYKNQPFFAGRRLVIATRHGKERILGPLLSKAWGVDILVPTHFHTDSLGTFSGEVPRPFAPLETARRKCLAACEETGARLALASEGSFGPHPVLGVLPANEEWLLLMDLDQDLEIAVREVTTDTNYAGNEYLHYDDLKYFAAMTGFPSHALILRGSRDDYSEIRKGLRSWKDLQEGFDYFKKRSGRVYAETDMRAHVNPSRQRSIRRAGLKLIEEAGHECPVCRWPGFQIRERKEGLPCERCQGPTESALLQVRECRHCGHRAEEWFPEGRKEETPLYCPSCNP